jgi:hypothetical protein
MKTGVLPLKAVVGGAYISSTRSGISHGNARKCVARQQTNGRHYHQYLPFANGIPSNISTSHFTLVRVEYIHVLSDCMHPNNKLCMKVDDDDDDDLDSLAYIVYNSSGTTKKPKGHCRLSSSWSRLFLAILNGVMRIFPTTKQELTSFNNNKQHQVEGCNVFFVAVGNVASLVTGTSKS